MENASEKAIIENVGGSWIWKCNFHETKSTIFSVINSPFLKNVLQAWSSANAQNPKTYADIINQYVWYNSYIKINGSDIHYKTWSRKEIMLIKDVLSPTYNSFLTYTQFKEKYNINITFLEYYGIVDAIPKEWKLII